MATKTITGSDAGTADVVRPSFGRSLNILLEAIRTGHAAECDYERMVAAGMPRDVAGAEMARRHFR